MNQTSKTILFFGTEDFSAYTLEALIEHGFHIGAIITKPDARRGRSSAATQPLVKRIGEAHSIPVWQPIKLRDIAAQIAEFDAPVGVLVSYGKIIPQSIIDLFDPGIVNLHPSLLPRYRGPSPIEAAILHGDDNTGLSIMQLSSAMDAGPVYVQQAVPLLGTETAPELYQTLGTQGAELLTASLPAILDGTISPTPQQDDSATYCSLITKQDGALDWNKPAKQLAREIRAYTDWPQSRTELHGIECIVTEAHAEATSQSGTPGEIIATSDSLAVYTSDGTLAITSIKPLGKKEMPVKAFLAGYKDRLTR